MMLWHIPGVTLDRNESVNCVSVGTGSIHSPMDWIRCFDALVSVGLLCSGYGSYFSTYAGWDIVEAAEPESNYTGGSVNWVAKGAVTPV